MAKPMIKIDVVSDVVCPWCYIGKRRLEKAINALSDQYDFEVRYFPFELNADMPAAGLDQKEYLTKKFGGDDRYQEITDRVTTVAQHEGLTFDFNKQKISPNTRNSHRLILLAKEDNKHLEMVEALFKAYFTDGIDLTKNENLAEIASRIGMDRDKVKMFLESETGIAEVAMAESELHRLGVSGVPFYIIDNKYGISGAQSSETFIQAFQNIGKQLSAEGEVCDVNEQNC